MSTCAHQTDFTKNHFLASYKPSSSPSLILVRKSANSSTSLGARARDETLVRDADTDTDDAERQSVVPVEFILCLS